MVKAAELAARHVPTLVVAVVAEEAEVQADVAGAGWASPPGTNQKDKPQASSWWSMVALSNL